MTATIDKQGALTILVVTGACAVLGAIQGLESTLTILALVFAALFALHGVGSRVLLPVLVVSTFVTRFRIDVAGFNFLPEHVLVLALVLALVVEGRSQLLLRAATDRTSLAMAAFIGWLALVSFVQAPAPTESLSIVGWLCLDWLILVSVIATVRSSARLERLTAGSSTALAVLALALWIAFIFAGSTLGTQGGLDYATGSRAVFAVSWEANILGSTLALWAFIGLSSSDHVVGRIMRFGLPLALAAMVVSSTRAAILGFGAGLLTWLVLERRDSVSRSLRIIGMTALVAVLVTVLMPQAVVPVEGKLGELLSFGSGNGALRLQAAETAIEDLKGQNAVVGYGANSFGQLHADPTQPEKPWYLSVLPLQILYDGGLVGVLLVLIALATVKPFRRPARAFGALAVYCSAATATSPFWLGTTWLLIALAVLTRPDDSAAQRPAMSDSNPR